MLTRLGWAACLRFTAPPPLRHQRQRHRMQARLRRVHTVLPVPRPHHRSPPARLKPRPGHLPPLHPHVPVAHPEDCRFTAMWHSLLLHQQLPKAQHRARLLQVISCLLPRHHQNSLRCHQSQEQCKLCSQLRQRRNPLHAYHLLNHPHLSHHPSPLSHR